MPSKRRVPARPAARSAPEGPHIRLGLIWAGLTTLALLGGPVALALVLAPVAAVAAAQCARSWRRRRQRAAIAVAAGGAGLLVLASTLGVRGTVGAVVVLAGLIAYDQWANRDSPSQAASPVLTGLIAVACGLAGASPVLLRVDGFIPIFVLFAFVHVYDASSYVVGTGANAPWEGPAAGVASIAAVSLAVAAVLSPPFRGFTPWLFGLLAGVLMPLGAVAARELVGDRRARVSALRRLDSLLVVGPVWALAAAVLLD